jgi:putative two-component system response regulator
MSTKEDFLPQHGTIHTGSPETLRGRVLIVDDIDSSAMVLRRVLEREGHHVDVTTDSRKAVDLILERQPDIVFLDVMMPAPNGIELCRQLKQSTATVLTPVILVTASHGPNRVAGLAAGADDFITKPLNPVEVYARVNALLRQKRYTDELESAESMIASLALTIEARDPSTDGHCQRIASYACALGRALGLESRELAALRRGGFLHDVGKVGVPDAILLKPGRLTREEYMVMQHHPVIGERLCASLRSLADVRPIVRHHHERLNGSGYPDGLKGDDIPLVAAITAIVDVFDALTTVRPYKPAMSFEMAAEELRREVATGLHRSDLVDTFLNVVVVDGGSVLGAQ